MYKINKYEIDLLDKKIQELESKIEITEDDEIVLHTRQIFINALVKKNANNSKLSLSCESLMLDSESRSDTIPVNTLETNNVEFAHEAKIGKISEDAIYYLMTRGMTESEAKALIVRGFAEPISNSFPVEYAVEMNRLIDLELEGTIG